MPLPFVTVYRKGSGGSTGALPADLASGSYELVFEGPTTIVNGARGMIEANRWLNRTIGPALPGIGGIFAQTEWLFTLLKVQTRVYTDPKNRGKSELILSARLNGFPVALLLIVLGILAGGISGLLVLKEIRRLIFESGKSLTGFILLAAAVGVAALAFLPKALKGVKGLRT